MWENPLGHLSISEHVLKLSTVHQRLTACGWEAMRGEQTDVWPLYDSGFYHLSSPAPPLPSKDYRARRKFSTRLWCESLTGPACLHRPRHHAQANGSSDITWRLYCNTVMEISRLRFKHIILGNLGVVVFSFKYNYNIFSFIGFNNQIQKMTARSEGI